jgi:hypothetical protein
MRSSGPSIYWEDPARFNQIIGAFLAKHAPTRRKPA